MKKELLYGTMAMGLVLTACSSDGMAPDDKSDVDRTFYVNVAVRGNLDGTRAASEDGTPVAGTDFENGTEKESEVKSAYFVFYDADGNVVGDVVNVDLKDGQTLNNDAGTVEKFYKSVVPVSVRQGQNTPSQVICYINPISPAALQNPINVVETVTRQEVQSESNGFPMSNSVYYTAEGDAMPQVATPIIEGQLFESESEANDAAAENPQDDSKVLNIYVERYASKLAFNYAAENVEAYTTTSRLVDGTENSVTLTFVPERWVVNAECNETYVVKSFRQPSNEGQMLGTSYKFGELNTRINGDLSTANAWNWNNSSLHRSFWAVSPAYFTEVYPEVASDATTGLNQHYYSYNELSGTNAKGFPANNTTAQYFRETTVGNRALTSKNPVAAVPSVIFVGKYSLNVNGADVADNTTFYTYMKNANGKALVYFEAGDDGSSKVAGGESMLNRLVSQVTTLFTRNTVDGTTVYTPLTDAQKINLLEIARPSDDVLGTSDSGQNKLAGNAYTVQFKAGANTNGVLVASGNGYSTIGEGNNAVSLTEANRVLMQNVGYARKYDTGAAYFNIPVKHYGWYRKGNVNNDPTLTSIDWSKVMVGDFGMVRNHSYKVNVTKVTGLATGIGGLDNPIVPPADTKDYYVAYRVNILQWAIVPQQDVEL